MLELASPGLPRQAPEEILAVHQALEELAALDPRHGGRWWELRYCGGFSDEEAAEALGVTEPHHPARLGEGAGVAPALRWGERVVRSTSRPGPGPT